MSNWLVGRKVRMIGDHDAVAAGIERAGGILVADGEPADLLVHVAMAAQDRPVHELSHDDWRAAMDAGLDQRFLSAKAFAAECRERSAGGAVLFVGSPEQSAGVAQASAAGALGNLTKTLGVEWARDGIRVNTILSTASDATIGNLAAYLLSDYAAYVTGAIMGVSIDD
ncbi:MAG: SDR family oxidoreductase [Blastomonas sp.]